MFVMSYDYTIDNRTVNIRMQFDDPEEMSLETMFANFMDMMRKVGYSDGSWDSIIDNVQEWRRDCGECWAREYSLEIANV